MAGGIVENRIVDNMQDASLYDKLIYYLNLLKDSDTDFAQEIQKLEAIEKRLTNQRFHLAVLGQFKRGKSTFVNSLIGSKMLPSSVLPLTSIPTYIQFDRNQYVEISFSDQKEKARFESNSADKIREFMAKYVTEAMNPKNRLNVSEVNLFCTSKLFADGMVIIDTPGIGSIHQHNTEATINFLPQCDAAIFVVSADPPITQTEIDFLKEIKLVTPKIFFVLNKIDYLSDSDLKLSIDFLRKALSEHVGLDGKIYPISALKAIESLEKDDTSGLSKSGVPVLKQELSDFFEKKKVALLIDAMEIKTRGIIKTVKMKINLAIKANQMPLRELDERLKLFNEKLSEIETEKIAAGDLIDGDKKRLVNQLEQQIESLRNDIKKELMSVVQGEFEKDGAGRLDYNDIYGKVAKLIPPSFERKYGELFNDFSKKIEDSLNRHNQKLNELTRAIWKAATSAFDINYYDFDAKDQIKKVYKPYWTTHRWDSGFIPDTRGIFDRFLPQSIQRRNAKKRLNDQIDLLVMRNAENLRYSLLQNINRLFGSFSQTFVLNIDKTITNIKDIIVETGKNYQDNADTSEKIISKLKHLLHRIEHT